MISTAEPQYIAYYIRGAISFMISNDSITDRKNNENDLQSAATKIGVQDRQLWHKLNLHRTGIVIHLETENRYPSVSNSLLPPSLPTPRANLTTVSMGFLSSVTVNTSHVIDRRNPTTQLTTLT